MAICSCEAIRNLLRLWSRINHYVAITIFEERYSVSESFVALHMRKTFFGVSLGRCHDVSFVSFTSLAEHVGSLVPLLLEDSVGRLRLCTLICTPYSIPQVEFRFDSFGVPGFHFLRPGLLSGTAVSVRLLMLDLSVGERSFTEVNWHIWRQSILVADSTRMFTSVNSKLRHSSCWGFISSIFAFTLKDCRSYLIVKNVPHPTQCSGRRRD